MRTCRATMPASPSCAPTAADRSRTTAPGRSSSSYVVDLKRAGLRRAVLVRQLEDAVVDVLADRGVTAQGDVDRPGVYVDGAKIAALGLKVRRGCSYHGLSFNADLDLAPFAAIDPCGYPGLAVTTARRLGSRIPSKPSRTRCSTGSPSASPGEHPHGLERKADRRREDRAQSDQDRAG